VDIKKFNRFLYSYQVSPTNVILCIIENTALVLHVLLEVLAGSHKNSCLLSSVETDMFRSLAGSLSHLLHPRCALLSEEGGGRAAKTCTAAV
jgi:hypothetical protein